MESVEEFVDELRELSAVSDVSIEDGLVHVVLEGQFRPNVADVQRKYNDVVKVKEKADLHSGKIEIVYKSV